MFLRFLFHIYIFFHPLLFEFQITFHNFPLCRYNLFSCNLFFLFFASRFLAHFPYFSVIYQILKSSFVVFSLQFFSNIHFSNFNSLCILTSRVLCFLGFRLFLFYHPLLLVFQFVCFPSSRCLDFFCCSSCFSILRLSISMPSSRVSVTYHKFPVSYLSFFLSRFFSILCYSFSSFFQFLCLRLRLKVSSVFNYFFLF